VDHGRTEDLQPFRQRAAVEDHRPTVLLTLVGRQVGRGGVGTPLTRVLPRGQRGGQGQRCRPGFLPMVQDPPGPQMTNQRHHARGRPGILPDPAPGTLVVGARRLDTVLHPGPQHRRVHDVVVHTLEPSVPPAHQLLQEPDGGTWFAEVRILVRPRPQQAQPWHAQTGHQTEHGVGIAVGPPTDGHDRYLYSTHVLGDGTVLPVLVAVLVAQPRVEPQTAVLQPLVPHLPPAFPHQGRVRGAGVVGEHGGGPGQVVTQQASPHVVHVVEVTVIGGRCGDDRTQTLGLTRRDLEGVETTPGDAHHPRVSVAPGLFGDPGEHFFCVHEFLFEVLVPQYPFRVTAAAQVDTDTRATVTGHVGVVDRVPLGGEVTAPIGNELQDRGYRVLFAAHGAPHPGGEPDPVAQRDQNVLVLTDLVRQCAHCSHVLASPLYSVLLGIPDVEVERVHTLPVLAFGFLGVACAHEDVGEFEAVAVLPG